uniref:Succinate dehydrogenase cytochrome b560 subunit, mitochondrial n=1 Tax=Eptatretus burgeri TaxID=7764 RepID=A0A8C4QSY7_EPTBU
MRQLGIRCPPAHRLITPTICSRYAVPLCTTAKQESKSPTRPLSPHVTIFRWPLPMMMSIAHRATGVFLAAGMVGLGLSSVLPGDYASQLSALQALGVSGFPIKLLLTVPLSYHTWNGIRHLAWDFGKGFKLTEVFRSGYIVLAFTLLSSLGLALM